MSLNLIFEELRRSGHKLTRARKGIVTILSESKVPLLASEIGPKLSEMELAVNRTTVYRELNFLINNRFIVQVSLADGKTRFEVAHNHHHHLVCDNCGKIEDVALSETGLLNQIKGQFRVLRHSIEFFGICGACQLNNG